MRVMHLLVLLARPLLRHFVLTAVLAAFLGTFAGLLLVGILLVVHRGRSGRQQAGPVNAR